jgi:hypothetical protein
MGFLQPWALLALPIALFPLFLERRARSRGEPVRFSSLYLLDRARRSQTRRRVPPARWLALLEALALLFLILAAGRPVAPGAGDPGSHRPTRAVVAVDVSASARQLGEGRPAWEAIRAAADSLLALAGPDDRVALASIADRVVGWWEGPAPALRRRLEGLEPTARPSDWPAALTALKSRLEDGTEAYLFTDGSRGAVPPDAAAGGGESTEPNGGRGYRAIWVWTAPPEGNRALASAVWLAPEAVGIEARAWGPGPDAATVGRAVRDAVEEPIGVTLRRGGELAGDAGGGPTSAWTVADTATFAFAEPDRHPFDDRRWVARGGGAGPYRVTRWAPPDEPPEPGALFWEAAAAAAARGATVDRAATLAALAARPPDLALLPLRAYRPDEAALLADLARAGTRLLFAPACADAACVPPPGWLPAADLGAPDLAWALGPESRQATLAARAEGASSAAVPEHLLAEIPVRGALRTSGGEAPDLVWLLSTGAPAFWARGAIAIWLVPLGPPVTRLGTTPIFPLVADAALGAWDRRWGAGGSEVVVGEPLAVRDGATVTGPFHAGAQRRTWAVAPGAPPPRPEAPGLYRVDGAAADVRSGAGATSFVAVNADPAEGDLTPVAPAAWRAAWGAAPAASGAWRTEIFPRRRGPELWPWALVLALAALVGEAAVRRAALHK